MFKDPRPSCATDLKPLQRLSPSSSNFRVSRTPTCIWKFATVETHNSICSCWMLKVGRPFWFSAPWVAHVVEILWLLGPLIHIPINQAIENCGQIIPWRDKRREPCNICIGKWLLWWWFMVQRQLFHGLDTKATNIQTHISYQTFLHPLSSIPQANQATWRKSLLLKTSEELCSTVAVWVIWHSTYMSNLFAKNFIIPISLETRHIRLSSQDCCLLQLKSLLHPTWYCCQVISTGLC